MKKIFETLTVSLLVLGLLVSCNSKSLGPVVTINSPPANFEFPCNFELRVSINATDTELLDRIEVFVDGKLAYTQSAHNALNYQGDFPVSIENCQPGKYLIEVQAININGHRGMKQIVEVVAKPSTDEEITKTPETPTLVPIATLGSKIVLRPQSNESGTVFSESTILESRELQQSTWPTAGETRSSVMARGLISFDISQIGSDSRINSALFKLAFTKFGMGLPPRATFTIDTLYYGFTIPYDAYYRGPYSTPYQSELEISKEINLTNEVQYAVNTELPRLQLRLYFVEIPDGDYRTEYGILVDMIQTELVIQKSSP
jgi:hypothetical protein